MAVTKGRILQRYSDNNSFLGERDLLYLLDDPDRNFNLDETNFLMKEKTKYVLAEKRAKHVYDVSFNKFSYFIV